MEKNKKAKQTVLQLPKVHCGIEYFQPFCVILQPDHKTEMWLGPLLNRLSLNRWKNACCLYHNDVMNQQISQNKENVKKWYKHKLHSRVNAESFL